ncbi:MAG: hypothetical protein JSR82_16215 [Verrucomicrobia bacterium]|nr:hypothetical protein [Verrucomicrobiota bacterium]
MPPALPLRPTAPPPPLPAALERPSLLPLGLVLGVAGFLALALGRGIGFGCQFATASVPLGPLLALAVICALIELSFLAACGLGAWRERVVAVATLAAAQVLALLALGSWLAAHADLLGWSLAVIIGLLFLLLLAVAVVALFSLLRAIVYWRLFRDPRVGWLAPLLTLTPGLLAALIWRLLG